MSKSHIPKPGEFCWTDAGFKDAAAAKKFYRSIFGWKGEDVPMGPGQGAYTMLRVDGKGSAGLYSMHPDQRKAKMPSFWLPYVAVVSVDRTVKKAKAAGATLHKGPMDVMDIGRMAILSDPTGAAFAVWQSRGRPDAMAKAVPGAFCWRDLNTPDTAAAAKFYGKTFGWKVQVMDFSGISYSMLKLKGEGLGGIWPTPLPKSPPAWYTYWVVKNCARTVAKAKRLGAKVIIGPLTVPETCTFAIIRDPQGAAFGALQPLVG